MCCAELLRFANRAVRPLRDVWVSRARQAFVDGEFQKVRYSGPETRFELQKTWDEPFEVLADHIVELCVHVVCDFLGVSLVGKGDTQTISSRASAPAAFLDEAHHGPAHANAKNDGTRRIIDAEAECGGTEENVDMTRFPIFVEDAFGLGVEVADEVVGVESRIVFGGPIRVSFCVGPVGCVDEGSVWDVGCDVCLDLLADAVEPRKNAVGFEGGGGVVKFRDKFRCCISCGFVDDDEVGAGDVEVVDNSVAEEHRACTCECDELNVVTKVCGRAGGSESPDLGHAIAEGFPGFA